MTIKNNKRNTPVATLIKNYVDKKSGKVEESRKEIQWRFFALDWKDQKRILGAFLEGGKVDRHWAYKQLLEYWDDSFVEKVRALWEQYHEQRCKWVVIRYLPLDYVRQNMHDFTEERDYYFACIRLAKDKDYVIERDKLAHTDYLSVLYHSGRRMDEQESLDILFQIVHDHCVNGIHEYELMTDGEASDEPLYYPIRLMDIRRAIYYLEKADCCKPVLEFQEWNDALQKVMNASDEYKQLHARPYAHFDYDSRKKDILRKYAYLALDDKYKLPSDPSVDEMLKPVEEYSGGDQMIDDKPSAPFEDTIWDPTPLDLAKHNLSSW